MDYYKRLAQLAVRLAQISNQMKINSDQISKELDYCNQGEFAKSEKESCTDFSAIRCDIDRKEVCISLAYKFFREMNDQPYDFYSYDEILCTYGCRHCQSARRLRKANAQLSRERGNIRSQITRIGKILEYEVTTNGT